MASSDRAVADIVRGQYGVISRRQALAAGLSTATIHRRLADREWHRLFVGVFLCRSYPLSPEARVWAASLAVPGATVSGLAAAWWWGLHPVAPDVIELTIVRGRTVKAQPGLRLVRRPLDPADVTVVRGVRVTGLALSALHGAVDLGSDGSHLLDRALQKRVSFGQVDAAYCRQLGNHRSAAAHRLMTAAGDGASAESERRLIRILRRGNVVGWECNATIVMSDGTEAIGDLVFRKQRVLVEADGWAWHHTPERFQRDRRRQNLLVTGGWTVLRFTWHDITRRPQNVLAQIRAALAAAA